MPPSQSQSAAYTNGLPVSAVGLSGLPQGASVDNLPGNMWSTQQTGASGAAKLDGADNSSSSSVDTKLVIRQSFSLYTIGRL